MPARALMHIDAAGDGPAVIRNALLAQVETPFVVFLDADDWVEPAFTQATLSVWKPGCYVYTDWYEDDRVKRAPARPWCVDQQWHVITALLPTEAARAIGFDERLPGAEDTAFYWQLVRRGICPLHLPRPLFHYGDGGCRSRAFLNRDDHLQWIQYITQRYGGRMGCCGGEANVNGTVIMNAPEPGDVLAITLWYGNRRERGRVTGRLYPRAGNGAALWVAPADIAAAPHLWQALAETPTVHEGFEQAATALFGDARIAPAPQAVPPDDPLLTSVQRRRRAARALSGDKGAS